jgi:Zn/Cd-binding protein ZinT
MKRKIERERERGERERGERKRGERKRGERKERESSAERKERERKEREREREKREVIRDVFSDWEPSWARLTFYLADSKLERAPTWRGGLSSRARML